MASAIRKRVFALLEGSTPRLLAGVHELAGEAIHHGLLGALSGGVDDPANRQRLAHALGRTSTGTW